MQPEYVVVGSGAGGGTVAARLAEAGKKVLLLEAGGDPRLLTDPALPDDYDVPCFHGQSTENQLCGGTPSFATMRICHARSATTNSSASTTASCIRGSAHSEVARP